MEHDYSNAVETYRSLVLKGLRGALVTDKETNFIAYVDKHCYSGYNGAKRPSTPSVYIRKKIVQMHKVLH